MAHGQPHVCGSLPKTHLSIHAVWCQAHQAWTLSTHSYQEVGDDIHDVSGFTEVEFGPFDDWACVVAELNARLPDDPTQITSGTL